MKEKIVDSQGWWHDRKSLAQLMGNNEDQDQWSPLNPTQIFVTPDDGDDLYYTNFCHLILLDII